MSLFLDNSLFHISMIRVLASVLERGLLSKRGAKEKDSSTISPAPSAFSFPRGVISHMRVLLQITLSNRCQVRIIIISATKIDYKLCGGTSIKTTRDDCSLEETECKYLSYFSRRRQTFTQWGWNGIDKTATEDVSMRDGLKNFVIIGISQSKFQLKCQRMGGKIAEMIRK